MGYEGTNRMKRFLMFALIMMVCLEGFSYQSTPVPQTFMIEKMPRAEFKFTSDTLKDINDFGSSATDNVYKAMTADSGGYEDDLTEDDRNLARGARFSISGVIDTYAYPTLTLRWTDLRRVTATGNDGHGTSWDDGTAVEIKVYFDWLNVNGSSEGLDSKISAGDHEMTIQVTNKVMNDSTSDKSPGNGLRYFSHRIVAGVTQTELKKITTPGLYEATFTLEVSYD